MYLLNSVQATLSYSDYTDSSYSDHHSLSHTPHDSPIIDYNQEPLSTSPKEKYSSSLLERFDIEMIPDFPSSSIATDRIASCPNSTQIIPNHYNDSNTIVNFFNCPYFC